MRATAVFIACIMASGCVDPEEQARQAREQERARQQTLISSELQQVQATQSLVAQQLNDRQLTASSLEREANGIDQQLTTLKSDVNAYIMNHKMASLCLAAGDVALSDDNAFSEDVKGLGQATALVCLAAFAAGANFRSEVIEVGDQLVQASARAKELESRLQTAQSSLSTARTEAAAAQSQFDSLNVTIQNLQLRLNAL